MLHSLRSYSIILILLPLFLFAQPKAQPCFFSEGFESEQIPDGWNIGPLVETTTNDGIPTGEFVEAWRITNAHAANTGGSVEIPDQPIGGNFVAANDDVWPCPCDLNDVSLTSPPIDLSVRSNVSLEFRCYHDMASGGGDAFVEASPNGNDWYLLHTIIPDDRWQNVYVDMSAWADPAVQIRFRWSDNGELAGAIAIDDVCMRERSQHDLSLLQLMIGDPATSPFIPGDQTLGYTMIPITQAGGIVITGEVMNRGTDPMAFVSLSTTLQLDGMDYGPFTSDTIDMIQPGERVPITTYTEWIPPTTGELSIQSTINFDPSDQDLSDNSASTQITITGPGWEDHYSAMAIDQRTVQGSIGREGIVIIGNRFEMIAPGTPRGVSAVIGAQTPPGTEVRAVLFDGNFAVIDTSVRRAITQEDIDLGWGGGGIYLPFSMPAEREAGDLFAGIQTVSADAVLHVNISGNSPIGASFLMEGSTFNLSYPQVTPMVRLHFEDVAVGVTEQGDRSVDLSIFPNPATSLATLRFLIADRSTLKVRITDLSGRNIQEHHLGSFQPGHHAHQLDLSDLSSGSYLISIELQDRIIVQQLVIDRE